MSQRPVAIGLLLCDQLIVEQVTKSVTPVNCFTRRLSTVFPWTAPGFTLVAWLTNGTGEVSLEIVLEQADTLEQLYRTVLPFRFTAPLQQYRLSLRLNSITFPEPAAYRVLLFADGELIAQRKLLVVSKEDSHD